ncbi:MAG: hypothetical protein ACPHUE_05040 [Flavobacteriaceae bacterium]
MAEIAIRILGGVGDEVKIEVKDGFYRNKKNTEGISVYGTLPILIKKFFKINKNGYNSIKDYNENLNYDLTIGLVGDSFIEGYHVDVSKSIGRLIENKCDEITVIEYGIGGYNIHNYIEIYESRNMKNFKKVYFFIHITDFLVDKPYRSKYNKFKETYFRPLYNASKLVKFINKNHKPFAVKKELNIHISQFTKEKTIAFLQKAKNVSFIYRNDVISEELDFLLDKIEIINHKRIPFNYGFDHHWNDNGRLNIADQILIDLEIKTCQNF